MMLPLLLWSFPALATLPLPTYPECGEPDRPDLCPPDLREYWSMISYIPAGSRSTVRPAELELGSGQWEDRAFRLTTGRFDTLLAICDSGIDWANSSYQNKVALNTVELPLPQGADGLEVGTYDLDGNGLVNVQDYAQDPRVSIGAGRDAADWLLDASDLIYTFSDGVDDDNNGFVDDIAGWDFYADDNDPYYEYQEGFGDHGDGVVEEMAAEGGDGDGDIGACPTCSVMMLRTGDTFVTDGSRVGMAIVYATDRGSAAVNMSLGALTRPDFVTDAVRYATEHDTVLVAVAGDENAYHHNQPALLEGMFYVHSIKSDTDDENNGVYSYLNFLNCNNFGPRLDLVAATPACATGAAAITTGVVGLVKSAAKDRGITLSNDEVYQILVTSATDVALTAEETEQAATYPSREGWDPFYGYGRVNAYRAVQMVVEGDLPPVARIDTPVWFDRADPTSSVAITGRLAAERSAGFSWRIEVATGHDPTAWTTVAEGDATAPISGTLATVDLSTLSLPTGPLAEPDAEEDILGRMERVFAPMVTVRATVTDVEGHEAWARKSFFANPDEDLLPGFPLSLPASAESSPTLADLDGDGVFEIVLADAGGLVHAFTGAGVELAGWPVETPTSWRWHAGQPAEGSGGVPPLRDSFIAAAAVGDLDGDGTNEVVVASGGGFVYAWHADGSAVDGFPVEMIGRGAEEFGPDDSWDNGFAGGATLADLDGDGSLEIAAIGMDQRLYLWDGAGQPWGPSPIEVCWRGNCGSPGTRAITSVTVGDLDGAGGLDLLVGTNEAVNGGADSVAYAFDSLSGTLLDGWPLVEGGLVNEAALLPIVGEGHPGSLALADLDGDGRPEVASPVMLGQSPLYRADGTEYLDLGYVATRYGEDANTSEPSFATMSNNPAFGDLTGDGVPDYAIGGTGAYYLIALALFSKLDYQHVLAAWDGATGEMLPGFPRQMEDIQFLVAPAIADVTGDGKAEVILGSAGYLVYAWDAAGNLAPGWPHFTGNWMIGSPAVGDIDGDGWLDVVVTTREGKVFAWGTRGRADQAVQWASMHHDAQNTGNYATALPVQDGPSGGVDDTGTNLDKGGCQCGTGGDAGAGLLVAAAALGLAARRREPRAG